ncbi:hypothetical protein I316_01031 [Kwoniella heveanensis BCC8398]|uniref:Nucleoporin Nup82 n=1 Tax=Kwoniella heveanensis BCC8398 TaxID=1296120 RepID=A0A1B9H1H8_9TREE|nr:hypothetical protein I316_01031 [Kwoniella heveanensis BCC8398]
MAQTIPFSLNTLRSHSIFLPTSVSSSSSFANAATDGEWELIDKPTDDLVGQKMGRMVMRDKDLLVAIGREVRMMSLGSGEREWEVKDGKVGTYRNLHSPSLNFAIHHVIPNPTGRLLAVVGHHQIVVLVLPKNSYSVPQSGEVECRAIPIDEFQFSPSSNDIISKVSWHPWGESGNSLWVLTANGNLREYDILQPHDPVQTFNFLPEKSTGAKFTAIDPLSRHATSFAFSKGDVDFSPTMVYVLIANGDLYTMGPILPLHTELPIRYLQGLKAYSEARLAKVQGQARNVFGASGAGLGRAVFQAQWVESLVKQVKSAEEVRSRRDEEVDSPSRRTTHRALLRQGPVVFSPGPQDVGNGDEDEEQVATDLYLSEDGPSDEEAEGSTASEKQRIVAIAWSGGRVDIGLEVEKSEPRWLSSRDTSSASPIIPIVESILLPYPQPEPEAIQSNAPTFHSDPLYNDIFYVQHTFGVDSVNLRPWLTELRKDNSNSDLPVSEVFRLIESGGSPVKPVVGAINFCNITLGYGLAALASTGQLAFVEMDLQVAESTAVLPPPTAQHPAKSTISSDQPDSRSLLLARPLDIDRLIKSILQPSTPFNPFTALKRLPDAGKPSASITPEHLRVLGEISSQVQSRTQAIRSASETIEKRLDLEVQEMQRQIRLLRECQSKIQALKRHEAITRAERLLENQDRLATRLDDVLRDMAEGSRPEIGSSERKWFEELERLEIRIRGGGGVVSKGKALATKAQVLREQLAALRPILAEQQREEELASTTAPATTMSQHQYGSKQLKPLEAALGVRSQELRRLIHRMETLDMRVDAAGGANGAAYDD